MLDVFDLGVADGLNKRARNQRSQGMEIQRATISPSNQHSGTAGKYHSTPHFMSAPAI